jgi:putative ABC transport system permease protein
MMSDIRFAVRQIMRTPLFSGVVIVVIALGIGVNSGLLTTLNRFVWQPAPGIEPTSRLARLSATAHDENDRPGGVSLSYRDVQDLRAERSVFTDVAAWQATDLAADFGSGTQTVMTSYATLNYFRVLGVRMAVGAGFPAGNDAAPDAIVVISHSLWTRHFVGQPDAIGKSIRVMNRSFTIVGVAPPLFAGVNVSSMGEDAIWIPLGARALLQPDVSFLVDRGAMSLGVVGRLVPGVEPDEVGRVTAPLAMRIAQEDPATHRGLGIHAERLAGMRRESSDRSETVAAFFLVAGLIVVITCTNVSALLLGRAVSRRREIGVRLSLGATRMRVVRQMLTESLVLALAGALLGLALYVVAVRVVQAAIPEVALVFVLEPATFAFAAMFALVTTLVFGLAPALHATHSGIGEAIKDSGAHAIRGSRLRASFVVLQLACSQPVLVMTSLVLADLRAGASEGEAPASVVTMTSEIYRLPAPGQTRLQRLDAESAAGVPVFGQMLQRLKQIPGVASAAISAGTGRTTFESERATGDRIVSEMQQVNVSAGWFATLGVSIVRGRAIGADEDRPGSIAVIVSEEAASRLWPGEDPIGKRLLRRPRVVDPSEPYRIAGASPVPVETSHEVIGVVATPIYDEDRLTPRVFTPLSSAENIRSGTIAVRSLGPEAGPLIPAIRSAIREVDPFAAVEDIGTLAEQHARRARETALSHLAALAVGIAALLLASLGLYAIIAFSVAQRTREIGVRLAVGATPRDVVRHFLRHGLVVTSIALAIGLPLTIAGIRVVKASILGFNAEHLGAVVLVIATLILVAALASWLPARRAARVNPLVALRSE